MISGLHSGETPSSSEVEVEPVVQHDDLVLEMDAYAPAIDAVHNDWCGGCVDRFLGAVSAVSTAMGTIMMLAGSVIQSGGERVIEDGVVSINNTVSEARTNMTQTVVSEPLGRIREGNSEIALGVSVMSFVGGCGLVGFGVGAEYLRRCLCGGQPRQ